MGTTFNKIASVSVGVLGASSIDFSSIPSTYTDLCVKISARDLAASGSLYVCVNGTTQTNQTMRRLEGSGSAASSDSQSSIFFPIDGSSQTSNTFANTEIYIPNYAGSTNKSMSIDNVTENNATQAFADLIAALWSQTTAINRLNFQCNSSFVQYSTATLYGVSKS